MTKTFTQFELNQCLDVATQSTSKLSPIWTAAWEDIKDKKSLYGDFKLEDHEWNLDPDFFAGAAAIPTKNSYRKIDFSLLTDAGFVDVSGVIKRAKRLIWIYVHSTSGSMTSALSKSKNLINLLRNIQPILKLQVHVNDDTCPDGPKLFSTLLQSDFKALEITKAHDGAYVLDHIADQVDDHFNFKPTTYSVKKAESKQAGNVVSLPAFSDLEITKILKQALYFSNLTELVIDFENWANPLKEQAVNGTVGQFRKNAHGSVSLWQDGIWKDAYFKSFIQPTSDKFEALGFVAKNNFAYAFGETNTYTKLDEYQMQAHQSLTSIIELSHRFLVAFFTGMRDQEIYALKHDCLEKITSENYTRVYGYDMKSDDSLAGSKRDWPLPDLCVDIIRRQQKLNEIYYKDTSKLFNQSKGLVPHQKRFANNISLENSNKMLKRMRPTIASIAMIASRSPVAVKAVLGHVNLDQTLGYARSNRNLQEEMIAQDKFVNRVLGRKVLDNVRSGKAPQKITNTVVGKSARFLGHSDAAKKAHKAITKLNIDDYAEVLDLHGDNIDAVEEHLGESFDFVNSFTLCAGKKGDFQGACSAVPGTKNPSNCQSSCKYRFDLFENIKHRKQQVEFNLEDLADFEPDEPSYYHRVNTILDCVHGFEDELESYKTDLRLITALTALADADDGIAIIRKLKPSARAAYKEIMGEAA